MNIYEIIHDLVEHSTLGGSHKHFLHWHLDNEDPSATPGGPEPVTAVAETPEQELARLRAENEALKQQGAAAENAQLPADKPGGA